MNDESDIHTLGGKWIQEQQNRLRDQIEDLRRRAKDNKSHNVKFFLSQAFSSLEHIRNLFITISVAGIGVFHSNTLIANPKIGEALVWSILMGGISYIFQYFSLLAEAEYYSRKEKVLSEAYPNIDQYKQMMADESKIDKAQADNLRSLSLLTLLAQFFLVICALYLLITLENLTS